MPVDVLCVRHGLSTWNLERRWQGRADPPLSDEGRRGAVAMAEELAAALGAGTPIAVWSSHLARATVTATIIAERLGAAAVTVDERLGEVDVGPWQGLTHEEIDARWPGMREDGHRPAGFEDESTVLARALPALAAIARATPPGTVPVVVAHAGLLRTVRRHCGETDERIENLGGWWFSVEPDGSAISFQGRLTAPDGTGAPDPRR